MPEGQRRIFRGIQYAPLPSQLRFHQVKTRFSGFSGPVGCVAGETVLDGQNLTISELCERGIAPTVRTIAGTELASVPYLKGVDDLYRVTLKRGNSVTCTLDHLLLAAGGWRKLRLLDPDDPIACSSGDRVSAHEIASIEFVRRDKFYDLTVPIAEHYFAHGILHHNSGKSQALTQEAIRLSVVNAGLLGLIGAPTYKLLHNTTERMILETLNFNDIPYEFNKSDHLLTFTELGSQIIFQSLEDPDAVRGTNLAWFGVDELSYCKEASWLRLQARLRHRLAKQLRGFAVWTPNGWDWVYDTFIGPSAKPDYQAIIAKPFENKHNPPGYYQSLIDSYDERFAKQEVFGEYLALTSGRVYYGFDRNENVKPVTFNPSAQLWLSCDFNVDPMCWGICQIVDSTTMQDRLMGISRRELQVLDEIAMPANIHEACEEVKRKIEPFRREHDLIINVTGDAAGNARTHIGQSDWEAVFNAFRMERDIKLVRRVPSSDPLIRDRVNSMNALLCNGKGERKCLIDPKCKTLIKDFERVSWREDSAGNITAQLDKSDPKLTHASDWCGYLAHVEFRVMGKSGERAIQVV